MYMLYNVGNKGHPYCTPRLLLIQSLMTHFTKQFEMCHFRSYKWTSRPSFCHWVGNFTVLYPSTSWQPVMLRHFQKELAKGNPRLV